jgi:fibronectin type 3 domain-containing protein
VTWTAATGATGYKVYRSIHPATPALIATVGNVTTFADTTAEPGAIYEYVVRSTNASGESGIGGADTGWRKMGGTTPTLTQIAGFLPVACSPDGAVLFGRDPSAAVGAIGTKYRWTVAGGRAELVMPAGADQIEITREDEDPSALVSANGSFLAGEAWNTQGDAAAGSAVQWSVTTPTVAQGLTTAQGISVDGAILYGTNFGPGESRAAVWRSTGQVTQLPLPQGHLSSWASDASATCDVVVGETESPEMSARASRWRRVPSTQEYRHEFLEMPWHMDGCDAERVSSDGSIVVGNGWTVSSQEERLLRWRNGRVTEVPGPTDTTYSYWVAMSGDGGTAVVHSADEQWTTTVLSRWTQDGGLQPLAPMDAWQSSISDNGRVIVGHAGNDADVLVPYVWTPSLGVQPLQQYLASRGIVFPQGATLGRSFCSPDGRTIFGSMVTEIGTVIGYRVASLVLPGAGTAPAPGNIRATDGDSPANVTVTWTAAPGATGYKVYRSIHPATPALIATVGNVTTFADTTAEPGAIYEYVVRSTNASGESGIGGADTGWRGMGATAPTPTLTQIAGFLPVACSPDGAVLFGHDPGFNDGSSTVNYRWTPGGGRVALGVPAGVEDFSITREDEDPSAMVSADGTFLAGNTWGSQGGGAAVRWNGTAPTVAQGLSHTQGISGDGSILYGSFWPEDVGSRAATWRNGTVTALPIPGAGGSSVALDASASCGVIVGDWDAPDGTSRAIRWRNVLGAPSAVQYELLELPAGSTGSESERVSSDGLVVLGNGFSPGRKQPVRWAGNRAREVTIPEDAVNVYWTTFSGDGSTGVIYLADEQWVSGAPWRWSLDSGLQSLSPMDSGESSISDNGRVIVGHAGNDADVLVPHVWTPSLGVQPLQQYLISRGIAFPQGATLGRSFCSPDGRTIFGSMVTEIGTVIGYRVASLVLPGAGTAPAPGNIQATDGTSTANVTVTWTTAPGATGYKVYRSIHPAAPALVATVGNVTSYVDATAQAGTTYEYVVRSTNASGESGIGGADDGWRNLPAPTNVQATDGTSPEGVTVTWTSVAGAFGYKVFRAQGSGVPVLVGATFATQPASLMDATAEPGIVYSYTVRTTSVGGDSLASAGNTGWRALPAPTGVTAEDGLSASGVTVRWNAVNGATGFKVFRAQGTAAAVQLGGTQPAGATSFVDTTAVMGTAYVYSVRAVSAPGDSASSASDVGWRNRAGPAGTAATDNDPTRVRVTWTAVTGTPAVTGYRVLRTIGTDPPVTLATVTASTLAYNDATAVAGTTYTYVVQASFVLAGTTPAQTVFSIASSDTGIRPTGFWGGGGSGDEGGTASDDGGSGGSESGGFGSMGGSGGSGGSGGAGSNGDGGAGGLPGDGGAGDDGRDGEPALPPIDCDELNERLRARISALELEATEDAMEVAKRLRALEPQRLTLADGLGDPGAELTFDPACAMLAGDVNLDGTVDGHDLDDFLDAWAFGDEATADLDRDGRIGSEDLARLIHAMAMRSKEQEDDPNSS